MDTIARTRNEIENWLIEWLIKEANISREDMDLDKPFADYHLDSLTTVELSYDLEEFTSKKLDVTAAFNYPTINKMSAHLPGVINDSRKETSIDNLLDEIENMTEKEAIQHMGTEITKQDGVYED